MRRSFLLLALCSALAVPVQAWANSFQLSVMQDDDQLVYHGDAARDFAIKRMKALGVDYARVTILWSVVAENAKFDRHGKPRKRFKGDDPRTYPKGNWDRYDRLALQCKALRIGCYFNVTGPGPTWAHRRAPRKEARSKATWKPKPREFFKFVKAVGKRYSGTYRDENDGNPILPRISFWSIYNEPNQAGWLTPQWEHGIPMAPVLYRSLWRYGRAALEQTGHGKDIILAGETAPLGVQSKKTRSQIYPKTFIRELFCLDAAGHPYTGSAARRRHCSELRKLGPGGFGTFWGHHPYTKNLPPTRRDANRESITMANIAELPATLAAAEQASGIKGPTLAALTEFGYETSPPDPFVTVSPAQQAEYINVGEYIAYTTPQVVAQSQFLLRDALPLTKYKRNSKRYWFTYQSGLYFASGVAKPAARAYVMPLVYTGRGTDAGGAPAVRFWGGVRFLPPFTSAHVQMQFRSDYSQTFQDYGDPVPVGPKGYFEVTEGLTAPGTWRAVYVNPVNGQPIASREVRVT